MSAASFIKRAWPKLIEFTEDPRAPITLQEAYTHADAIGRMVAGKANKQDVGAISEKLLSHWSDEELEHLAATPEFLMAVSSLFCSSLVAFTKKVTG